MASAASLLDPPSHYWTYLADGGHVTQVSYPAGSFLLEAPAMALGFHHELADWTDLVAWLATGVLLFVLLPVGLRWLAALVLMAPAFVGAFSGGRHRCPVPPVPGAGRLALGPLRHRQGAGTARWIGPLALGVACSVKQTPWFCLPLLLIGLGLEARRRGDPVWRVPARYLAVVVGVFAACNLPFVIWGPRAWADGLLLPFTKPLVADGQGLVTLAIHGLTGGVVLPLLSVAAALAYLALLAAFVVWYPGDEGRLALRPPGRAPRAGPQLLRLPDRLLPRRPGGRRDRGPRAAGGPGGHGAAGPAMGGPLGRRRPGPRVGGGLRRWPSPRRPSTCRSSPSAPHRPHCASMR